MIVLTATAAHVTATRFGGTIHIYDGNTGNKIGQCDLVRGFACYTGVRGSAHQGFSAVVAGGLEGLIRELAKGIKNGRDDRA
jgi:hypothetical protein